MILPLLPVPPDLVSPFCALEIALPVWFRWDVCLPYFTTVVLLPVGLTMALRAAPTKATWFDRLILCGPVFIAMPMVMFGTEHFLDPSGVASIIPAWIPAHLFWAYLVGTGLVLGGLSILLQKHVWLSAGLFGVMLLGFEVLMHIPRAIAAPGNEFAWRLACRDLSFGWGALAYAATYSESWRATGKHWVITLARLFIGVILLFGAVEYFLHPELLPGVPLRQRTPDFIPGHLLWGYLNSMVFAAGGLSLLLNRKTRLATGWVGLFVLLVTVFLCVPYMLPHWSDIGRGLNVPVDTLLMCGALFCLAGSLPDPYAVAAESAATTAAAGSVEQALR